MTHSTPSPLPRRLVLRSLVSGVVFALVAPLVPACASEDPPPPAVCRKLPVSARLALACAPR